MRSGKDALGMLVTLETGKLIAEGRGEVQEMIDICDFAVGLSRQLHGLTIASERPDHRMLETWHPYGVVRRHLGVQLSGRGVGMERGTGARVWRRRRMEAVRKDAAFGDRAASCCCDKRSEVDGSHPTDSRNFVIGDRGRRGIARRGRARRRVISPRATAMGRAVGGAYARRFKRTILELGGNNAVNRLPPPPS